MQLLEKENIFFTTTSQIFPELVPIKSPEAILKQMLHKLNGTCGLLLQSAGC